MDTLEVSSLSADLHTVGTMQICYVTVDTQTTPTPPINLPGIFPSCQRHPRGLRVDLFQQVARDGAPEFACQLVIGYGQRLPKMYRDRAEALPSGVVYPQSCIY